MDYMKYNISPDEIRDQVLALMREHNMYPAKPRDQWLILDDKIHRYQIEGRKNGSTDGAYVIHPDGIPAGFIQDWATPNSGFKWNMKGLTRSNKPDFDIEKWQKERKKREAEIKRQQEEASYKAYEYFQKSFEGTEIWHRYLDAKQVRAYGIRLDLVTEQLVIPLRDINGNIQSVQTIDTEGKKLFFYGAPATGMFFSIELSTLKEGDGKPILVAEGYATAAKIYQITGYPIVAAMNCGNLGKVVPALRGKFQDRPIIIMADNDLATFKKRGFNPGLEKAKELVAQGYAKGYIAPPFDPENPEGSDWDDYAIKYGDNEARKAMLDGKLGLRQFLMDENSREKYFNHIDVVGMLGKLDPSIQLPPQEFIGGIFPRGFISAVVAPPGTGKTVFMQKTVSDLSMGGIFFDGIAENEPPRKCLVFAAEAGYEMLLRRGASFKWPINPDNVIVADQYKYESQGKSLMLDDIEEGKGLDNVKDIIKAVNPDIVFFDTFPSFHESDENKATEMKPIMRYLTTITRDKNIAVVLNQHSRKRTAKERTLLLNQDDVIGSSILNRLVGLIIGIEHVQGDEENLQVRPLKSWFRSFRPFNFKIAEDIYGHSVIETNLDPEDSGGSRVAVWNYLVDNFNPGEWFSIGQIALSEIDGNVSERMLRKIISELVRANKLTKRGENKGTEYSVARA